MLRSDDMEDGAELVALAATPADAAGDRPAGGAIDSSSLIGGDDADPVLDERGVRSNSESLRSSLTGSGESHRGGRGWGDRGRDWWGDVKNARTRRLLQFTAGGLAVLILIVLLVVYAQRSSGSGGDAAVYPVRLPMAVRPSFYTLELNASLVAASFDGRVAIDVLFEEPSAQVLLHALDLRISDVTVAVGDATITPQSHGHTGQHDLYLIQLERPIAAGTSARLHMRFAGLILPTLAGFYLSTYTNAAGETRSIASTQFESTDARRAFPCFDEPSFKANFSIAITTEAGMGLGVLSNMPPVHSEPELLDGGRWQRVQFQPSVRMSTYLVAWVISDFTFVEGHTARGVPVRVWTAPEKLDQTDVALRAAIAALDRYEDFFQVVYPLPKQDMVAIPNFPVGAMENWGLVTYRETALLVNNASREAMTEQNVVTTVAHELAHQWFGNLVTMSWWDDLYLNEGFASFVEWIGMQAYNPQWDEAGQLIASTQTSAFTLDASQYSHPIVQTVNDPAEIDGLFDMISYDKGCSVLLMLADVLGYNAAGPERHFQTGLQRYLQQHAFGNAASADLWTALQSEAPADLPVPVADLMGRYTTQVGYPLVTLAFVDPAQPLQLRATQSRFVVLPYADQDPALRDTQSSLRWDVLLRYFAQGGTPGAQWLLASDEGVVLDLPVDSDWILANHGRYGFYRVNYPAALWATLAAESRRPEASLSNSDLCGLLDDVWSLAMAGRASYASAFDMSAFLADDFREWAPWSVALSQIGRLARLLSAARPDAAERLSSFVVTRLIRGNVVAQPPWDSAKEDHMRALLQQLFVSTLVAYDDASARAVALELFQQWVGGGAAVPVDIRDAVYRVGVEEGGAEAWDRLYASFRATIDTDSGESRRILRALTRSPDPDTLRRLLDWSSDTGRIKSQDQSRVVIYVALNPKGREVAWQWLKSNYDLLFERFGAASFTLSELISRVVGEFHTPEQLADARAFFADRDLGTAKRALLQAYETVQINIYWLRERFDEFDAELTKRLA